MKASFPVKCRVLSRVFSHSHCATPDLNLWLLYLSWHILCPGNTAVGKIMEEFIVIFSQEILPVFSVRQLFDGPTRQWMSFPRFSLVGAFKLSA